MRENRRRCFRKIITGRKIFMVECDVVLYSPVVHAMGRGTLKKEWNGSSATRLPPGLCKH